MSVARGGAVAARPENAMALEQNPAGMSLFGSDQVLLNVDVAIHDMCVDPYGYYGWGVYDPSESRFGNPIELDDPRDPTIGATYASSPLPKVCNSAPTFGLPQMAWVGKLSDDVALGAGLLAPTLLAGMQYGGEDGTIDTPYGPRPTPTRYQLINQEVKFAFAPMVGVGWRVLPALQVGATLQIAMLDVVNRAVENFVPGTQPSTDWLVEVRAHDYFLPAVTLSANLTPLPGLDVMGSFRWADNFDGSGKVTYTTNVFQDPDATAGPVPFKNDAIKLSEVKVGLPWTATLGVRYAGLLPSAKLTGEKPGIGDPMDKERWDVEVDASYNWNERSDTSKALAGQDVVIITRTAGAAGEVQTEARDEIGQTDIDRHLKDSISLRAGGSFSVLPRRFAIDAGVFYETRGIEPAYVSVDSFALQRMGFGVGALVRLGDFDLMAAYGHIFQETVDLAPPDHEVVQKSDPNDPTRGFDQRVGVDFNNEDPNEGVVLRDPAAPSPSKATAVARYQTESVVTNTSRSERVVNAGKYTAAFNIISVGAVYHF
jgi:hypothetical protein